MFTGLVAGLGTIVEKRPSGGGLVLGIEAGFTLDDPLEGESIAVNGVCLTGYSFRGNRFLADVSPESLSRTGLGRLQVGARVNLERALRLADRLGGHIVSGHVDCLGRVEAREAKGDFTLFTFSLQPELARYVIEKGSVTINGVSLTVNQCAGERFQVSIIPHTLVSTTLGGLQQGDMVNIEVDIIGKYVEKLLSVNPDASDASGRAGTSSTGESRINSAFLAQHGFF